MIVKLLGDPPVSFTTLSMILKIQRGRPPGGPQSIIGETFVVRFLTFIPPAKPQPLYKSAYLTAFHAREKERQTIQLEKTIKNQHC